MKKVLLSLLMIVNSSWAQVQVVSSTTDIAWAVREIGGKLVHVDALLEGTENPHYVDAVPEFIRLASNADIVFQVGMELEVGWMPKVLSRSGNANVQPGGKGFVEVTDSIKVLGKKDGPVDRSMGDVHPAGNPHFWISPVALKQSGEAIRDGLIAVDPKNMNAYMKGYDDFEKKMERIYAENKAKLAPFSERLQKPVLMEYHEEFAYFLDAYGLISTGSLEEKPGVPPSAGRLAQVAVAAKKSGIVLVVAADTAPKQTLKRFEEMSKLPVIQLPMSLYPEGGFSDYEKFQNHLVDSVVEALKSNLAKGQAA